ncbi:MAG: hypothetical protein M1825_002688 [Sarcosagium campestre]|nr:MAG: hypothetical protein M1825_002688 [Sarcosagium campestre]
MAGSVQHQRPEEFSQSAPPSNFKRQLFEQQQLSTRIETSASYKASDEAVCGYPQQLVPVSSPSTSQSTQYFPRIVPRCTESSQLVQHEYQSPDHQCDRYPTQCTGRHPAESLRQDRANNGHAWDTSHGQRLPEDGQSSSSTTAPLLRDLSLVAEAARRAQVAVLMRDMESVTI